MRETMPTPTMAEALRLTRAGRLSEATALIQRSLGGAPASTVQRLRPRRNRRRRRLLAVGGSRLLLRPLCRLLVGHPAPRGR